MTKAEKIPAFDPNSLGQKTAGMYGLPFTADECDTVLIPVPWEVTVSYGSGTAGGPAAIFEASYQVDLYDPVVKDAWKKGIAMDTVNDEIEKTSGNLRRIAKLYIECLENGEDPERQGMADVPEKIREGCLWLNKLVKSRAGELARRGKIVGLVGGDHSTPLGFIQHLADTHKSFAILQIDAHADLRDAYEGFEFSHASIMFNALKLPQVERLVQVGIRDYCEAEAELIKASGGRIKTFFDRDIRHAQFNGDSWDRICNRIIRELPAEVYLSFDIDGLDPRHCPNTGTPVAGGFEVEEVLYLLEKLVKSGRRIIGYDLNEVSPGDGGSDWDANVAARLLYRIANLAALSNGR
jgi:agmatinase